MGSKRFNAMMFAVDFAQNDIHGYAQDSRWDQDADCSSLVIRAWEAAGVLVKTLGATYTGNMLPAFIKAGFAAVAGVDFSKGTGLLPGDVLLKVSGHTAIYIGGGQIVQAAGNEKGTTTGGKPGDQTGREIYIANYYNSPWDYALRFIEPYSINPFPEPKVTYKAGVTFRGDDARWFIWELVMKGHDLLWSSDVFGKNSWNALYQEQEKAGLKRGDAGPDTRAIFKPAPETNYKEMYEKEKFRADTLQARINDAIEYLQIVLKEGENNHE